MDALVHRKAIRTHLGAVFENPEIVKVMHGADSDIVWLQRDFGIYVTNLFDTGKAARVLQLKSHGLAHLLEVFCGVKANKAYQLADWRQRPLTADMRQYAREDTHYLLSIFDKVHALLSERPGALDEVLSLSTEVALQTYRSPSFHQEDYLADARKCGRALTQAQFSVYAGLFAWRDRVARQQDESLGCAKRPRCTRKSAS